MNSQSFELLEPALERIMAEEKRHGSFLGLLAHLEYVGARKIAKSLPAKFAIHKHLEHLMEEARHATLLRAQAEALIPALKAGKELSFSIKAEQYLQMLDRGIEFILEKKQKPISTYDNYLLVSLIIEERAMKFYPLYLRLLPEGEIKKTIQSILQDEVGHLDEMRAECQKHFSSHQKILEKCRELEQRTYDQFFWPVICELAEMKVT